MQFKNPKYCPSVIEMNLHNSFILFCGITATFAAENYVKVHHFFPLSKYLPGQKLLQELPPDEVLSQFAAASQQSLQESVVLQNFLTNAIEDSRHHDTLLNWMKNDSLNFHSPFPDLHARTMVGSCEYMMDYQTPTSLNKIMAFSYGRLLKDLGLLTEFNAAEHGKKYSDYLERTATLVGPNPPLGTAMDASVNAGLKFLDTFNILSPFTGLMLFNNVISETYNLNNYDEN